MVTVYLLGLFTYSYHKYFNGNNKNSPDQAAKVIKLSDKKNNTDNTLHLSKYFKSQHHPGKSKSLNKPLVAVIYRFYSYPEKYIGFQPYESYRQRPPPLV